MVFKLDTCQNCGRHCAKGRVFCSKCIAKYGLLKLNEFQAMKARGRANFNKLVKRKLGPLV